MTQKQRVAKIEREVIGSMPRMTPAEIDAAVADYAEHYDPNMRGWSPDEFRRAVENSHPGTQRGIASFSQLCTGIF